MPGPGCFLHERSPCPLQISASRTANKDITKRKLRPIGEKCPSIYFYWNKDKEGTTRNVYAGTSSGSLGSPAGPEKFDGQICPDPAAGGARHRLSAVLEPPAGHLPGPQRGLVSGPRCGPGLLLRPGPADRSGVRPALPAVPGKGKGFYSGTAQDPGPSRQPARQRPGDLRGGGHGHCPGHVDQRGLLQ